MMKFLKKLLLITIFSAPILGAQVIKSYEYQNSDNALRKTFGKTNKSDVDYFQLQKTDIEAEVKRMKKTVEIGEYPGYAIVIEDFSPEMLKHFVKLVDQCNRSNIRYKIFFRKEEESQKKSLWLKCVSNTKDFTPVNIGADSPFAFEAFKETFNIKRGVNIRLHSGWGKQESFASFWRLIKYLNSKGGKYSITLVGVSP